MIEMVKVMVEKSNNWGSRVYDAIKVKERIVAILGTGTGIVGYAPVKTKVRYDCVGLRPIIEYSGTQYIANDGIPLFNVKNMNGNIISSVQIKQKIEDYVLETQDVTNDSYYDLDYIHKYTFLKKEVAHRIQIKYKSCYYDGNDKGENVLMKKIFIGPEQKRIELIDKIICSIRPLNGKEVIVYREFNDNNFGAFRIKDLTEPINRLDKIIKIL